jgi:hypothetical protein
VRQAGSLGGPGRRVKRAPPPGRRLVPGRRPEGPARWCHALARRAPGPGAKQGTRAAKPGSPVPAGEEVSFSPALRLVHPDCRSVCRRRLGGDGDPGERTGARQWITSSESGETGLELGGPRGARRPDGARAARTSGGTRGAGGSSRRGAAGAPHARRYNPAGACKFRPPARGSSGRPGSRPPVACATSLPPPRRRRGRPARARAGRRPRPGLDGTPRLHTRRRLPHPDGRRPDRSPPTGAGSRSPSPGWTSGRTAAGRKCGPPRSPAGRRSG